MAFVDQLFQKMAELNASDLHLTSGKKPILRVDGEMHEMDELAVIGRDEMLEVLLEITPLTNREEFESCSDTDFAYELEGVGRFRANLFRDHRGPGGVFRLIPSEILTAEQLGLPAAVMNLCTLSKGLVLVTGPTGSGKSTTLAAMLDFINKTRSEHIITIEDPVEFVHPHQRCLVNQREVGRHTESFKRALRAALREDPDVILVGELRDLETIAIAIETAETGHLVFGTLHTTTAASTVDRIIDQFPAGQQEQIRTMLASSLKGVVAQTLCKRQPKGRVAALEVLIVNSPVAAQIREGKVHQIKNSMQTGAKFGMQLLNNALVDLVGKGLVHPMEAYSKAIYREEFLQAMQNAGIRFDPSQPMPQAPAPQAAAPQPAEPQPQAPLPGAPSQPAAVQPGMPRPAYSDPQPPQRPLSTDGDSFEAFRNRRKH